MFSRIRHAPIKPEYFRDLVAGISCAVRYGPLAVAVAGKVDHPELLAETADLMLRLKGIKWSMVIGQCKDTLYISIRTWPLEDEDASQLIRRTVKEFGRSGGHGHRAGAQVDLKGMSPESVEAVINAIIENFCELRPGADEPAEALLPEKNP